MYYIVNKSEYITLTVYTNLFNQFYQQTNLLF